MKNLALVKSLYIYPRRTDQTEKGFRVFYKVEINGQSETVYRFVEDKMITYPGESMDLTTAEGPYVSLTMIYRH